MEQFTIGRTDLRASRICLGTMTFGGQTDEATAAAMLDLCLGRGVNFVDTANIYTGGASEEILGRLLKGRRDRVLLASKVGMKVGDAPDQQGLSRAAVFRQIDETLGRLQTDHLDFYYLHQPDYATPIEETLDAMAELVRIGKVRHLGASNYAAWQTVELLWHSHEKGFPRIEIVQPMYNLLARNIENEFLPMCAAFALSAAVYNPLAGGFLTGKHPADQPPAKGTRFDANAAYQERYWHGENFTAMTQLADAAASEGRSLVSLALGWLLHHTQSDCVVLGASRMEQLEENLAAAEAGPLSEATLEVCGRVWARLRGVGPKYNR